MTGKSEKLTRKAKDVFFKKLSKVLREFPMSLETHYGVLCHITYSLWKRMSCKSPKDNEEN